MFPLPAMSSWMTSHEIFRTSYSSAQVSGTYIRRAGTIVLSLLTPNLAKASLLSNPIRLLSSITKPDDVVDGALNNTDSLNDLAIRKHFTECKLRQHRPAKLTLNRIDFDLREEIFPSFTFVLLLRPFRFPLRALWKNLNNVFARILLIWKQTRSNS